MEIFLTILGLILLAFIALNFYNKEEFNTKSSTCHNNDIRDTHAVKAPNIPNDPQCRFKIGGKYCKSIGNQNISPVKGKYVFPIEKLLYDGIYHSNNNIKDNVETQKWSLVGKPWNRYYATNKFYHVPKNHFDSNTISSDPTIFYGDWNILNTQDRNQYELDKCSNEKYNNYKKSIVYWSAGV